MEYSLPNRFSRILEIHFFDSMTYRELQFWKLVIKIITQSSAWLCMAEFSKSQLLQLLNNGVWNISSEFKMKQLFIKNKQDKQNKQDSYSYHQGLSVKTFAVYTEFQMGSKSHFPRWKIGFSNFTEKLFKFYKMEYFIHYPKFEI